MTVALLLLAGMMAVVVAWLIRQSINVQPWVAQRPVDPVHHGAALPLPPVKVGLVVFLAVATSLFALLVSAYFMRRMHAGDWTSPTVPGALWINTAVLALSDFAVQRTRGAARRGQLDAVRAGLIAGGVLGLAFLAGQLWVWQRMQEAGLFLAANPANAFFYLLTAVHGAHLAGGLWVWGRTTARAWRGGEIDRVRSSVELCTVYWHYLLLVWLVLFVLLLFT